MQGMGSAAARLQHHFEVERELAERLRRSTAAERAGGLYEAVYAELFRRVPDHPQNLRRGRPALDAQERLLGHYLRPTHRYLELGAGDCVLALRVAPAVAEAVAVDVADLLGAAERPANFRLLLTDGVHLPVEAASVDVAYSDQLMEHLHPEDAVAQLARLRHVLRPGGIYLCVTPNRLTGPHDVSRNFGQVACGLHLREYAHRDLVPLLRAAGFGRVRVVISRNGRFLAELPVQPFMAVEWLLERAPDAVRRVLRRSGLTHWLLGVRVAAYA